MSLPGLGYTLTAVSVALRVVDIAAQRIQASAALSLARQPAPPPALNNGDAPATTTTEEPNGTEGNVLRFNARMMTISQVHVRRPDSASAQEASFKVYDYMRRLVDANMARDLQSLSACLAGDLKASEEGELHVVLPFADLPASLVLEIEYSIDSPAGVVVMAAAPAPHCYTQTGFGTASEMGAGCGLRCWLPCVDTLRARFDLSLALEVSRAHVAVASGVFTRRLSKGATAVYVFEHAQCAPHAVGWAVGPFVRAAHPDCAWASVYALPPRPPSADVASQLAALAQSVAAWLDVPPPPTGFALVLVPAAHCIETLSTYAGVAVMSDAAVLDATEAPTTPRAAQMAHLAATAVAALWLGCRSLAPAGAGDVWAPMGLAQLVALHAVGAVLGDAFAHALVWAWTRRVDAANERAQNVLKPHARAGFSMARALSRVRPSSLPVDSALWSAKGAQWDSCFAHRAALVARMLEQRVSPQAMRQVLRTCVRVGAASGCPLSELSLLSVLRARHPHDVDGTFVAQWLRRAFTPRFEGRVVYNAKHNRLEVVLRQISTTRVYVGAVRVRVVEEEGAWEFVKQVDNVEHRWHLECRSRRPKGRGGRKRPFEEDLKLGRKFWENATPVKYVLLDPEGAWLMRLRWSMPEEYWLELLHDAAMQENVRWLAAAVDHLAEMDGSLRACAALVDVVTSTKKPDVVRAHAAAALGRLANGATHALAAYKTLFVKKEAHVPVDLANVGEAMVRPALLRTLAGLAALSEPVRDVLRDALRHGDEGAGAYDDAPVTAALAYVAGALGDEKFIYDALDFDRVAPGAVSEGCLGALAALCGRAMPALIEQARPFPALRLAAFKGVVDVYVVGRQAKGGAWMRAVGWCLRAAASDPTPWVRRAMLKVLLSAHADTINLPNAELNHGELSTAGCFWPMQNVLEDMTADEAQAIRQVGDALWALINDVAFDSVLRMLAHSLWRSWWGTNIVGPLEREGELGPELGTLERWVDESEKEWERDERMMLQVRDIADIGRLEKRLLEQREGEKRSKDLL